MKTFGSVLDLIRRILILFGWIRDSDLKEQGRKEVSDAVSKVSDKHRDAMRSSNGNDLSDDQPDLFRDR